LDVLERCKKLNAFLSKVRALQWCSGARAQHEQASSSTAQCMECSISWLTAVLCLLQGLLGKVELDDELLAACSAGPKQQLKPAAAAQQQQVQATARVSPVAANTPRPQPLTSRITAKESAALLELLGTDEEEQPAAVLLAPGVSVAEGAPAAHRCACSCKQCLLKRLTCTACWPLTAVSYSRPQQLALHH
jgi:hypothetical protein